MFAYEKFFLFLFVCVFLSLLITSCSTPSKGIFRILNILGVISLFAFGIFLIIFAIAPVTDIS